MVNACIAIGIEATAGQGLGKLPGAVNGATAMAEWAKAAGYATELVIDRGEGDSSTPVDAIRVRDALMRLLPAADDGVDRGGPAEPPQRLIVYFAGHGMQSAADGELWLLSDSYNDQMAIGVARLQSLLQGYLTGERPGQITIISDACRSPMIAEWNISMTPAGVIPRGPYDPNNFQQVDIDQFLAVPPRSSAFMVRATEGSPARCIFTSVLLEALHGVGAGCFDQDDVTSDSLAAYLRTNVSPRARQFGVEMNPRVFACFISPDDIYVSRRQLGGMSLPPLDPWPGGGGGLSGQGADTESIFNSIGDSQGTVRGGTHIASTNTGAGAAGAEPTAEAAFDQRELSQIAAEHEAAMAKEVAQQARAKDLLAVARRGDRVTHLESQAGLTLAGSAVTEIACAAGFRHEPDEKFLGSWRIWGPEMQVAGGQGTWALAFLGNGQCVATTVSGTFITDCILGDAGCQLSSMRPLWLDQQVQLHSEELLANQTFATSDADDALGWLGMLVQQPIFDPMLGVLAAYVFHCAGQQDNVRRVAAVFAERLLAVPFDIALLAGARARREEGGVLIAEMGEILRRRPRSPDQRELQSLLGAHDAFAVPVSGRFPLMRQGWFLLDIAGDDLVIPGLRPLAAELTSAPFATFGTDSAATLKQVLENAS